MKDPKKYATRIVERNGERRKGVWVDVVTDRKNVLPYGAYVEADGALVFFDRDYKPLWRTKDQLAKRVPVSPDEWIDHVNQFWFYDGNKIPKATRDYLIYLDTHNVFGKWESK